MSEKSSKTVTKSSKSKKGKTETSIEKPVKEAPKTITATVATDRYPLNIRNAADSESNIIGQLPKGSKIKVLDEPINGFYQLADQPGFVLGSKLKI